MASRVFFRSLASSAKAIKPPVELFGLDGTYANALYSAAVQDSTVPKAYEGLTKVNDLFKTDAKVSEIISNSSLTREDRDQVVDIISSNLKLDKTIANFLRVLADNNRLSNLKGIHEKFGLLNDAEQGIVEAKITSAKQLDSKILRRLQASIAKSSFVGDGKTLKLNNIVSPEVLGGLVVEVGDKTVDLSIASKVARLNQSLNEAL